MSSEVTLSARETPTISACTLGFALPSSPSPMTRGAEAHGSEVRAGVGASADAVEASTSSTVDAGAVGTCVCQGVCVKRRPSGSTWTAAVDAGEGRRHHRPRCLARQFVEVVLFAIRRTRGPPVWRQRGVHDLRTRSYRAPVAEFTRCRVWGG